MITLASVSAGMGWSLDHVHGVLRYRERWNVLCRKHHENNWTDALKACSGSRAALKAAFWSCLNRSIRTCSQQRENTAEEARRKFVRCTDSTLLREGLSSVYDGSKSPEPITVPSYWVKLSYTNTWISPYYHIDSTWLGFPPSHPPFTLPFSLTQSAKSFL